MDPTHLICCRLPLPVQGIVRSSIVRFEGSSEPARRENCGKEQAVCSHSAAGEHVAASRDRMGRAV